MYCIVPEFFTDNYSSKAFDGIAFYSETCMFFGCDCQTTEPNYTMADAIVGRSAEVVVGYHNSVGADYSRDVMKTVIEESFNGETISNALAIAKSKRGNTDNWEDAKSHKWKAYPIISGNGDYTIRPDGIIKGSVKAADSNAVIANALIRAYNENGKQAGIARSAYSGSYSLSLSPGTYTLEITAGSYKKGKALVTVNAEGITYVESFLLVSNMFNLGNVNGQITDSVTEDTVADVTIKFRRNWNNKAGNVVATAVTNSNGYYEVNGLFTGLYTMEYYKSGYATGYKNISIVYLLEGVTQNAIISPVASDGVYRIVLTWGENPNDLDSHVVGTLSDESSFHVYYSSKSQYDGDTEICNLDVDDTTSYGPETITVTAFGDLKNGFTYAVHDYSNRSSDNSTSLSESGAIIKLYKGATLLRTYNVPTSKTGTVWNVFAVDKNGNITDINTFDNVSDPENVGNINSYVAAVAKNSAIDTQKLKPYELSVA